MSMFKKIILYGIYIVFVTVFFLFYLFPQKEFAKYINLEAKQFIPDYQFSVGNIHPILPPGVKLMDLSLSQNDNLFFKSAQLKLKPNLFSLVTQKKAIRFDVQIYKGDINGTLYTPTLKSLNDIKTDIMVSNIMLQEIPILHMVMDHNLFGKVDGTAKLSRARKSQSFEAKLDITKAVIELAFPVFEVENLNFSNIEMEIAGSNNRININKCTIKGQEMDGNVAGFIILKPDIASSRLNLSARISPFPEFLAKINKSFPTQSFFKKRGGKEELNIVINGTFKHPNYSLR